MSRVILFLRFICLIFLSTILNCTTSSYPNNCEFGSKAFLNNFILSTVVLRMNSYCGITNSATAAANAGAGITFTSFSFTSAANDLNKTYTGTVTGNNIAVELPYGKITTAIPTIGTNATTILAGSTSILNGVTALDFTNPITFTLINSNGGKVVYTVTVYAITPVEDTGQTACSDNNVIQPCSSMNATFPRQDAHFIDFPNPKGVQTPATNPGYPSDFITKNTLTGIVWKTCLEGKTGFDCSGGALSALTYANAVTACANLNSANSGAGYAGIKNWRLPALQELMQGQVFLTYQINWDVTYFPTPVAAEKFPALRSSNLILPAATSSMIANGAGGNDGMPSVLANSSTTSVRCVAGSPFPNGDLVDNNDGTILDKRSKLYWQKCALGQNNDATCSSGAIGRSWQNVLQDCNNLTILGKQWRTPNIIEFTSLIDTSQTSAPYINTSKFVNFPTT
ncbi:MAG TPA: DUF1566 domain-containing protein, partial [Leptospiraceae bacterium]|nr:DUF1566 domain-containing protein [Leptospiraceae bacterium]